MIGAEFRSSHRGLLPSIRHSRDSCRPLNISNSTFKLYTSILLPSPKPYKRPYSHTHQTILVSTKPTTVIKQLVSRPLWATI